MTDTTARLIAAVNRARAHLMAEANDYIDDGQNEPLEIVRQLDAAVAAVLAEAAVEG